MRETSGFTRHTLRATGMALALFSIALTAWAQPIDVSQIQGTSWYGLYMNGQKIGFAKSSV